MPKRLARNPSTRSLKPATRNRMKAIRISPDVIAHRITGTARMRASVIRLGMLKPSPRLACSAEIESLRLGRSQVARSQRNIDWMHRSRRFDVAHPPEYSGAQAIAQGA